MGKARGVQNSVVDVAATFRLFCGRAAPSVVAIVLASISIAYVDFLATAYSMSQKKTSSCIMQFAKAPLLGTVKTRMSTVLTQDQCVRLHQTLVSHVFHQCCGVKVACYQLWGSQEHAFFSQQLCAQDAQKSGRCTTETGGGVKQGVASWHVQQGDTLGQRMSNAFCSQLCHYNKVVIIGSDCPFVDAAYIEQAIMALDTVDVVVGPAEDGGYVLLGLKNFSAQLFCQIPWGTSDVLAHTRYRLSALGWRWKELEKQPDIDRPEDLFFLRDFSEFHEFHGL